MPAKLTAKERGEIKAIGTRIRDRRIELGLSQTDLGKALNITFQQVQKYENGNNRVPLTRLDKIADVLQTEMTELFGIGASRDAAPAQPRHPHSSMILHINQNLWKIKDPRILEAIGQIITTLGQVRLPERRERNAA